MLNKDITIVSVYHSSTARRFLELNYALTKKLNPEDNWVWILGDNTPLGFKDKILEGEKFAKIVRGFDEGDPSSAPDFGTFPLKKIGCYWHGGTINKVIKNVHTRFLLVLDNNFYVVRNNWLNDAMNYMKENNLAFFGAPNPASNPVKYRYFPEVHCFFVDLEKVALENIDFMPSYELLSQVTDFKKYIRISEKYLEKNGPKFLSKVFDIFLADRLRVGRSGDVGTRMLLKYGGNPEIKTECVSQVFNPSLLQRLADIPFSERFSILPKQKNYYVTGSSFLPEEKQKWKAHNFEEYMWKNSPFGFHIRGRGYGKFRSVEQWEELFGFIKKTVNL